MFALGNFPSELNVVGALFVHPLDYKVRVYLFKHRGLIRDAPDEIGSSRSGFGVKVIGFVVETLIRQ